MSRTMHGKIHGRTIELDEDPGVADGQEVEVQVRALFKTGRKPGEGFLRTEGALADDTEWDANHGGNLSGPEARSTTSDSRPGGTMNFVRSPGD
jgi:hypothetical protein